MSLMFFAFCRDVLFRFVMPCHAEKLLSQGAQTVA